MVRAIEEQATSTAAAGLSFDERLTLLVQREVAWRDDPRPGRALKPQDRAQGHSVDARCRRRRCNVNRPSCVPVNGQDRT
jgi:hypothetical protein